MRRHSSGRVLEDIQIMVGEKMTANSANYTKYYKWMKTDKDRYFETLYFIHTKNGARLLYLIPTELKKHKKIIMQEYKDAWWLFKGLHNLSIPRMLHAVLFHCVRKYGWKIGEGKAYQTLYYQIKAKDEKIVRCQGGGRNRINYYMELCKLIPEWQEVKEKYHKEKKNGKENGEEG